ncbi:MAG TPA: chemotaxis protein CheB, partial [Gammaproteobacteria bacterium]|nr:chemotaxis protein CheB [Gammaproteobacteria bacterium]
MEAFTQLLKNLPDDTGMAFVLIQHLDPDHDSSLVEILRRATSLPVTEVSKEQAVKPDHIYVISPNTSLILEKGCLQIKARLKSANPHKPVDIFFESLAAEQRDRAIGVVLSGTASDGTQGLEAIKAEAGITFAQDGSAKYDSMPRSAVNSGCVDKVLSPGDIAKELALIGSHPYIRGEAPQLEESSDDDTAQQQADKSSVSAHSDAPLPPGHKGETRKDPRSSKATKNRKKSKTPGNKTEKSDDEKTTQDYYKKILLLLRHHTGTDFSLYKSNTIQRRINRRVVLSKQGSLHDYIGFLRGNQAELDALYTDVLISVTSFFRNPDVFETLKKDVFPKLLK